MVITESLVHALAKEGWKSKVLVCSVGTMEGSFFLARRKIGMGDVDRGAVILERRVIGFNTYTLISPGPCPELPVLSVFLVLLSFNPFSPFLLPEESFHKYINTWFISCLFIVRISHNYGYCLRQYVLFPTLCSETRLPTSKVLSSDIRWLDDQDASGSISVL